MRRIHGYRDLDPDERGSSAAIGNFDGVHRGHQVLLHDALVAAKSLGAPLGAITFDPHPRRFFLPDTPPFLLTTRQEKARILEDFGVALLYRLDFNRALASMAPEDFVRDVLIEGLGIRHLVIGADFRFGKDRRGDAALLQAMSATHGFGLTVHEMVGDEEGEFASTAIRAQLREGCCRDAAAKLGRWHAVTGTVQRGDQRGRTLGYPTANLDFGEQLIPRYGVYASRVTVHDGPHRGIHDGVASIGERPTFGENRPNFEVHLFDFTGDLYGAEISASLVEWLRDEVNFTNLDALIAQMDQDSIEARAALASANLPAQA